jgi:hypothetical protein
MNNPMEPETESHQEASRTDVRHEEHGGVWPPPIGGSSAINGAPLLSAPFKFIYRRLKGSIADFREGSITVSEEGILIAGRSVPRSEIYNPIILVCALFSLLFAVAAHFIMRYGTMHNQEHRLSWRDIHQIVLVPNKNWIGISYSAPNYRGTIKLFCFCFALQTGEYQEFAQLAQRAAPNISSVGKLKPGVSFLVLFMVALLIVTVLLVVLYTMGTRYST